MENFHNWLLLFENLAQAKSILLKKGLTTEDETYQKIITKTNKDTYTGLITRLIIMDGEDMQEIFDLYDDLKKFKYDLSKIHKLAYDEIINLVYQEVDKDKTDIKKLFSKDGYTYYVVNYNGVLKLGSPSWCLKTKSDWNRIIQDGFTQFVVIRNDKIVGNTLMLSVPNTYTSLSKYQSNQSRIRYGITTNRNQIKQIFDDNNDEHLTNYKNDPVLNTIITNIKSIDSFPSSSSDTKIQKEKILKLTEKFKSIFSKYSDVIAYDEMSIIDIDDFDSDYFQSLFDSDSLFIVFMDGDKGGVVDINDNIKIPLIYDHIERFRNQDYTEGDNIVVMLNDKYGILNRNGEELLPIKYDSIDPYSLEFEKYYDERYYSIELDNKWGLINDTGEIIIPIRHPEEINPERLEDLKKYK